MVICVIIGNSPVLAESKIVEAKSLHDVAKVKAGQYIVTVSNNGNGCGTWKILALDGELKSIGSVGTTSTVFSKMAGFDGKTIFISCYGGNHPAIEVLGD